MADQLLLCLVTQSSGRVIDARFLCQSGETQISMRRDEEKGDTKRLLVVHQPFIYTKPTSPQFSDHHSKLFHRRKGTTNSAHMAQTWCGPTFPACLQNASGSDDVRIANASLRRNNLVTGSPGKGL